MQIEGRKGESLLKPPLLPSLIVEGRILGFVFCFSPCLIMLVLAYSVVLSFVACLYVGLIWRVLFCVVLGCFLVYLDVLY